MSSTSSLSDGAAGEIRTPEVRHHWISNPAQWPGYATAARTPPTFGLLMKMTVRADPLHGRDSVHSGPKKPSKEGGMNEITTKEKNIQPR